MKINLFVLCKNSLFIRRIEEILYQEEIFLSDVCTNPDLALTKFLSCSPVPDIILLDANWVNNGHSGFGLLSIFLNNTSAKVIMVTTFFKDYILKNAKREGAHGYIIKHVGSVDELADNIKAVYTGINQFDRLENIIKNNFGFN